MNPRKWLLIIVLLLLAYLAWKYLFGDGAADRGQEARDGEAALILDRVWVDGEPERYTDFVHAMLMLSDIPMGVFQKASAYQMKLEVFEFKREASRIGVRFPQTGTSKRFSYKVRRCNEKPPFDLCLDLSANPWRGPKRYYSLSDDHASDALVGVEARLRQQLRAR